MNRETAENILIDWKRLQGRKNALRTVTELNGCSEQEARRVIEGQAGNGVDGRTMRAPTGRGAGSGAPGTEPPTEGSRNKAKRERLGAESLAEIDRLV